MNSNRTYLVIMALVAIIIGGSMWMKPEMEPENVLFEDFESGELDLTRWTITSQNDFEESIVDVYEVGEEDNRLRLSANTLGTDDSTVKFHGVMWNNPVTFLDENTISFEIDWNNQTNGSYLTAGMYLTDRVTDENPRDIENWLRIQYLGVPPGKNSRLLITEVTNGVSTIFYDEDWPQNRTGRKIGKMNIELTLDETSYSVSENGKTLIENIPHKLSFTTGYVYFQMSSHSNYSPRVIYFDNFYLDNSE